eukprot:Sspe_Gene.116189::Locus_104902_Transcript_1_1_Confidence_1.000_Length_745::g.116189::m.116189
MRRGRDDQAAVVLPTGRRCGYCWACLRCFTVDCTQKKRTIPPFPGGRSDAGARNHVLVQDGPQDGACEKHRIVRINMLIEKANRAHVQHMSLYECPEAAEDGGRGCADVRRVLSAGWTDAMGVATPMHGPSGARSSSTSPRRLGG